MSEKLIRLSVAVMVFADLDMHRACIVTPEELPSAHKLLRCCGRDNPGNHKITEVEEPLFSFVSTRGSHVQHRELLTLEEIKPLLRPGEESLLEDAVKLEPGKEGIVNQEMRGKTQHRVEIFRTSLIPEAPEPMPDVPSLTNLPQPDQSAAESIGTTISR